MAVSALARTIVKAIFGLRIPANPFHRLLAWEYQLRRFAFYELLRIVYFQPMFESLCRRVGRGVRLELTPDSKLPPVLNVDLELGDRVRLNARATFSGARNSPRKPKIVIGDDSYLGTRAVLRAGTEIVIGKHVLIAANALLSGDPGHPMDPVARRTQAAPAESLGRIVIGDDAWLAYNVSVLGNVTIGEGAIVAAGSVVTKDVPPYALVAGNPARVIRTLKQDQPAARAEPSSANKVQVNPSKNELREAIKHHYVQLFADAEQRPDGAELETVVERAFNELDQLEQKHRGGATEVITVEQHASK